MAGTHGKEGQGTLIPGHPELGGLGHGEAVRASPDSGELFKSGWELRTGLDRVPRINHCFQEAIPGSKRLLGRRDLLRDRRF